ncbi:MULTISPECIES: cytochrome P450 [unclassified Streptomyces]|uniref:cytochrome P450 n=1 Tax=unclassified Streptomyces TaxID=2593676 RepID=UPI0004AB773F|nr:MULTISPECIES: cytochrome P450 [unclassified Streptomyces]APU43552.1 cytochrome [Streptomyces sp. TN58]KJK48498.1 cytochrome P450 [Streptomyces sp. NRRL F-4428]
MTWHDEQARRDELYRDPYPLYDRARRAEGLTYVPEFDAWLVARDRDVREVLLRAEDFSSANALLPDVPPAELSEAALAVLSRGFGPRPTVVSSDGAAHRRHRAPLNRGLSAGRVAALVPYARACAAELVDGFAADGSADLVEAYARRLPGMVVGRLIGLDPADVPAAVLGGYRAEELLFRPLPPEGQAAAAEDVVALQHLLDGYVRDRRDRPRDDLCSAMVSDLAPGTGELTLEQRHELVTSLQNLLIAGFLTTGALIGTALMHLLDEDRRQWRMLCADPSLIPAAVEEAARHDTAIQAFRRTTTRPVALGGSELPAGAAVLVAYGAANRDGERYERAGEFDITRPVNRRHLAFGHGPHGCPGSRLAREQLRLTLELLTSRLPGLRPDPGRPRPRMRPTLIHRSPEALHAVW